jgi:hypothetical protein
MAMKPYVKRYAQRKLMKRVIRAVPVVGTLLAVATLGRTLRQKGLINGTISAALDAVPFVGGAKILAEAARGRDFLPDLPRA